MESMPRAEVGRKSYVFLSNLGKWTDLYSQAIRVAELGFVSYSHKEQEFWEEMVTIIKRTSHLSL